MKKLLKSLYSKIFNRNPTYDKPDLELFPIEKYREFGDYSLDIEVYPSQSIFISAKLPSEPPQGITYNFGPTGYIGDRNSNYCVIPTVWRNVNNYCHWTFTELPFLFLAFESPAENIVLPNSIIDVELPFQKRWMELLYSLYPDKKVFKISEAGFPKQALFPVNHDTSTDETPIGKAK